MTTDFSVIDQMFSAMLSQNESKATIDALRPKVEAAVKELIVSTSACSAPDHTPGNSTTIPT